MTWSRILTLFTPPPGILRVPPPGILRGICICVAFVNLFFIMSEPILGQVSSDSEPPTELQSDPIIRRLRDETDREARQRRLKDLGDKAETLRTQFQRLRAEFDVASGDADRSLDAELEESRAAIARMFARRHFESETRIMQLIRRMSPVWKELAAREPLAGEAEIIARGIIKPEFNDREQDLERQWLHWYESIRDADRLSTIQQREKLVSLSRATRLRPALVDDEWLQLHEDLNLRFQAEAESERRRWSKVRDEIELAVAYLRQPFAGISQTSKLQLVQLADLMTRQCNAYWEQQWISYRESISLARTQRSRLMEAAAAIRSREESTASKRGASVAGEIERHLAVEVNEQIGETTKAMVQRSEQWVRFSKAYRDRLAGQLDSLRVRMTFSDQERIELRTYTTEIELKYQESCERLIEASKLKSLSIRDEIDRLKNQLIEVDVNDRGALIDRIEKFQVELDQLRSRIIRGGDAF